MLPTIAEAERRLKIPESAFSQLYHLAAFKVRKPMTHFEKGMLIISIDIDVGSGELGVVNQGKNDVNVHQILSERAVGKIEEDALPFFVDMFETLDMPVTFALRGQCLDVDASAVELLLGSSVKHDIGSHGYTHRKFKTLSRLDAVAELNMTAVAMREYGIIPRSFIFPQDSVAHLNLLEEYGYTSFRSFGSFLSDRMQVEKQGRLYNICPSIHLTRSANALLLKKLVDVAVSEKAPFHVWFHLWNFGFDMESIRRSLKGAVLPFLLYAREKVNIGELSFETMFSVVEKIERSGKSGCLRP
jgi:hypothetical protein